MHAFVRKGGVPKVPGTSRFRHRDTETQRGLCPQPNCRLPICDCRLRTGSAGIAIGAISGATVLCEVVAKPSSQRRRPWKSLSEFTVIVFVEFCTVLTG